MSRTKNVVKNFKFSIIRYVAQLVLQFVVRTALIYFMGAEYLGLNGLFSNILSFLNLAELGIGSAIVFNMYRAIADNDTEKIKSLQDLYRKFYIVISIVVAGLGLLILPFLKFFIKGDVVADINIYLLYLLYLISTLLSYLSAHKRCVLFAYERNDIENKIKTLCLIGMNVIQILVLFLFKNYYIFFSINILFSLIEWLAIHITTNKMFPQLIGKANKLDKQTKNEITKNITALSVQKIGNVFITSTDNIVISSLLGLIILGAYSNYYLIISSLITIFTLIINALTGSVGSLIASKGEEYVYAKYKQINFLFSFLTAFVTICMIVLFQPFVKIWTGGGVYLLNYSTVLLLCLSFYLTRMRSCNTIFKDAAGLFWQNRFAPIVEALINVVVSIVLGLFIGINGVIIGTILSTVLVPMWFEPKILYKHYFKKSIWDYFKTYIRDVIIMILAAAGCYGVCWLLPTGGLWWLVCKFAVCAIVCLALLCALYAPTKEFKEMFNIVKTKIKSLKNKKTSS